MELTHLESCSCESDEFFLSITLPLSDTFFVPPRARARGENFPLGPKFDVKSTHSGKRR